MADPNIPENLIIDYLDGQLSTDQRVELEKILESRPELAQQIDSMKQQSKELSALPQFQLSSDFSKSLLNHPQIQSTFQSIVHGHQRPQHHPQRGANHWSSAAAAVATLAAALLLTLTLTPDFKATHSELAVAGKGSADEKLSEIRDHSDDQKNERSSSRAAVATPPSQQSAKKMEANIIAAMPEAKDEFATEIQASKPKSLDNSVGEDRKHKATRSRSKFNFDAFGNNPKTAEKLRSPMDNFKRFAATPQTEFDELPSKARNSTPPELGKFESSQAVDRLNQPPTNPVAEIPNTSKPIANSASTNLVEVQHPQNYVTMVGDINQLLNKKLFPAGGVAIESDGDSLWQATEELTRNTKQKDQRSSDVEQDTALRLSLTLAPKELINIVLGLKKLGAEVKLFTEPQPSRTQVIKPIEGAKIADSKSIRFLNDSELSQLESAASREKNYIFIFRATK